MNFSNSMAAPVAEKSLRAARHSPIRTISGRRAKNARMPHERSESSCRFKAFAQLGDDGGEFPVGSRLLQPRQRAIWARGFEQACICRLRASDRVGDFFLEQRPGTAPRAGALSAGFRSALRRVRELRRRAAACRLFEHPFHQLAPALRALVSEIRHARAACPSLQHRSPPHRLLSVRPAGRGERRRMSAQSAALHLARRGCDEGRGSSPFAAPRRRVISSISYTPVLQIAAAVAVRSAVTFEVFGRSRAFPCSRASDPLQLSGSGS